MRSETPSASAAFDSDSAWRSRHSSNARTSPCPVADSGTSHSMPQPSPAPADQARPPPQSPTSTLTYSTEALSEPTEHTQTNRYSHITEKPETEQHETRSH